MDKPISENDIHWYELNKRHGAKIYSLENNALSSGTYFKSCREWRMFSSVSSKSDLHSSLWCSTQHSRVVFTLILMEPMILTRYVIIITYKILCNRILSIVTSFVVGCDHNCNDFKCKIHFYYTTNISSLVPCRIVRSIQVMLASIDMWLLGKMVYETTTVDRICCFHEGYSFHIQTLHDLIL